MLTTLVAAIGVLVLAVLLLFIGLGVKSRTGSAPGLVQGRLASCPASPNCVCSEYAQDNAHYIAPLPLSKQANVMTVVNKVIIEAGGKVIHSNADYLAATFSSRLFGFVDDVELRLDTVHQQLQMRSASRVGQSDLGVNRQRMEKIKHLLATKLQLTPYPQNGL